MRAFRCRRQKRRPSATVAAESRIDGAVEDGSKAVVNAEVHVVAITGGALLQPQQDFFGGGLILSKSYLISDFVVLAEDVEREPLEKANVGIAVERKSIAIHVIQVLRDVGRSANRSPRSANTDRRVEGMAGDRFPKFVEDCNLPVLESRHADRILERQTAFGGLAIREEIILDGGRSRDRAINVGEAGMIDRRPGAVRPLGAKTFDDKGIEIPAVRVAVHPVDIRDLKGGLVGV